jgi:hypothetical protein
VEVVEVSPINPKQNFLREKYGTASTSSTPYLSLPHAWRGKAEHEDSIIKAVHISFAKGDESSIINRCVGVEANP